MRHTLTLFLFTTSIFCSAQSKSNLQKLKIADSGFAAAMIASPDSIQKKQEADGSVVWTVKSSTKEFTYRMVLIKSKTSAPLSRLDQEELLKEKLTKLQEHFYIERSEGYQPGNIMERDPDVRGFTDFWYDKNGNRYSVKAWMLENYFAILTVNGHNKLPPYSACRIFFNEIEFPL